MRVSRTIWGGLFFTLILIGSVFSQSNLGPCFYTIRYSTALFGNPNAFLDTYDLIKNKVISSEKIDSRISGMLLNNKEHLLFLFRESPTESKPLHEIKEYDITTKRNRVYIKNSSLNPIAGFSVRGKLYFLFDNIIKSNKEIQKNPNMSNFQNSGLEVYTQDSNPKWSDIIRLNEDDYVWDFDINEDKTILYLTVDPLNIINKKGQHVYNREGLSFLYAIDLKTNKILFRKELSMTLKGIHGIKVIGEKLYITSLYTNLHTDDPNNTNDLNKDVFVFELNSLKLIKKIRLEAMARKLYFSPEDNRLFVLHQGPFGSKESALTVVDIKHDNPVGIFKIPGIEKVSYIGAHRLIIITNNKLVILDTQTLKIIKELKGTYGFIAEKI